MRAPPLDPTAQAAVRRGAAARQEGRPEAAQAWFRLAACAAPADRRVVPLVLSGDAGAQIHWSRRVLCLDPLLVPILELRGRALAEAGEGAAALALFHRAFLADPGHCLDAAFALSDALARSGRAAGAYPLAWRVATALPENPTVQVRLAAVAGQTGRVDVAASAFLSAVRLLPAVTDLSVSAVAALRRAGRHDAAWRVARQAALLAPGAPAATLALTDGIDRPARVAGPRVWSARSAAADPRRSSAWDALARAARGDGDMAASLKAARRGLLLQPGDLGAARALAQAASTLARHDLARRVARTGRMAHPGDGELAYQLAQAEKAVGDLALGWDLDALRVGGPRFHRTRGLPPRVGAGPLPASGLLVAAEQGIGDELLFLSCLPELLAECPDPVVEADARFHPLLGRSFPGLRLIDRQIRADGAGAVYDYVSAVPALGLTAHLHAGDLPGRYRRDRRRPAARPGYLRADPDRVEHWRGRLAALPGEGRTVGLCWRSMLGSGVRSLYYADLAEMLAILRVPGYRFVCLQYDDCADELDALYWRHGVRIWRPEDLDQREDLDGVAALIAALDLVVSAATSVCVLSAALGRPTIRLAPSFYSILDDADLFFPSLTPVLRRDEPVDVSVAIARAAAVLADGSDGVV